jgi:BCD family chlorophyll transporter-like MFS transporter
VIGMLGTIFIALRLALPKIGVGWMFALLTSNFNRITIYELGVTAVLVTTMIGMHNFLSPFQMVFGRIADKRPVLGLRRTPYMIAGATIASLVFLALPGIAEGMGSGSPIAFIGGFVLLLLFGVSLATMGDSHHSMIAERIEPARRGGVISVVWTFTILSAIMAAGVIKAIMPTYTPELMQNLYNLTPIIVIGSTLLGIVGMERRLKKEEIAAAIERARRAAPPGNPIRAALTLMRENPQVRNFFAFVLLSILAIFMQDAILEVFGAEVFGMSVRETTSFTQIWGGGVLGGMLIMGILSSIIAISKKTIAMIGGAGTAVGLGMLTICALTGQQALLNPSLVFMGLFTGFFNVGALALMMEMTVEGATGLYMGMWGTAQAFGNGLASFISGGLKTALIETNLLSPQFGYTAIFGIETIVMVIGVAALSTVSIVQFRGFNRADMARAMEVEAGAAA